MDRRSFIFRTGGLMAGAVLAGKAFAQAGSFCVSGDPNVPIEATIRRPHGHRLLIPRQHIVEGTDRSYDIQGASTHGHVVIVTREMFAQLRQTGQVELTSSTDDLHSHAVILTCEA